MVEEEYGADTVAWFDEHHYGNLAIPETQERAEWYQVSGWPCVRVDGSCIHMGIYSCPETAHLLSLMVDGRLEETGGMSPVAITGTFRADEVLLEWDITFRLLDPAILPDLRGTFVAIEDDVPDIGRLFPRVTRVIHYEPVTLASPGDSAEFVVSVPRDPGWDWAKMRAIVFLQQTSGEKEIIQGAVLPNELTAGVDEPAVGLAAHSRITGVAPNPFTASIAVTFHLSETASRGPLTLEVLDPLGRRVRRFPVATPPRSAGPVAVTWDGASDAGEQVPVGSYFFRLTTSDAVSGQKVLRVH